MTLINNRKNTKLCISKVNNNYKSILFVVLNTLKQKHKYNSIDCA